MWQQVEPCKCSRCPYHVCRYMLPRVSTITVVVLLTQGLASPTQATSCTTVAPSCSMPAGLRPAGKRCAPAELCFGRAHAGVFSELHLWLPGSCKRMQPSAVPHVCIQRQPVQPMPSALLLVVCSWLPRRRARYRAAAAVASALSSRSSCSTWSASTPMEGRCATIGRRPPTWRASWPAWRSMRSASRRH